MNVQDYLISKDISYTIHEHPAVFTCEDAEKHCANVPGIPGKNLFLRDQKGNRHFLVIMPATKRADMKVIAEKVGEKKLSFGSPERLKDKLGIEPGAVSPFGLLNDENQDVEVYVDKEMYNAALVNFHPNTNTASLELTGEMFQKYLESLPHEIHLI